MSGDDTSLTRRSALKAAGLGAGTLAAGGGVLLLGSSGAIASSMTIQDAETETTDDGQLNYVRLQLDHDLTWDGFEEDVEYIRYVDSVTVRPNDENVTRQVNDTTSDHLDNWSSEGSGDDGWGGPDEYASGAGKAGSAHTGIDWNIIGDPDASDPENGGARSIEEPADLLQYLEADDDGQTKESLVQFHKKVLLLDGDQNELDRDTVTGEFVVTVENEPQEIDQQANGEASADGDNEEP